MDMKTPDPSSAWTSNLLLTPSFQREAAARPGPNRDCAYRLSSSPDPGTRTQEPGTRNREPGRGELGQLHLPAWQAWQSCVPTTGDANHSVWTWEVTEGSSQAVLPRFLVSDTIGCYMLYARCWCIS